MQDDPTRDVAFMLGRISGDVKHILQALTHNQEALRELDDKVQLIDTRVVTVESANKRLFAYMGIAVSALTFGINFAIQYLGGTHG